MLLLHQLAKSRICQGIAPIIWAVSFFFRPKFWTIEVLLLLAYNLYVLWPTYDRQTLNEAVLYFLKAVGIDNKDVRACLYIPGTFDKKKLYMVSDYMPGANSSPFIDHYKYLDSGKGIVGQVYASGASTVDLEPSKFNDVNKYREYLSANHRFTQKESGYIDANRKGFYGIPVIDDRAGDTGKEKCVGVLYIDTSESELFKDQQLLDRLDSAARLFEPIIRLMGR